MWRERLRSEEGVGMMVALLAVLIISGLVVVFMVRALTETRLSSSARDRESAIHVAEAGIDAVIAQINDSESYVTKVEYSPEDPASVSSGTPHDFTPALDTDQATERAWAVDVATNQCQTIATADGETCGIRPEKNGAALPWIYGVGFVPDRANAEKIRVIKIQFDKGFYSPEKAILTNGDLTVNGRICGPAADVHSNSNVTIGGNGDTVTCADPDGNVTSTGTYAAGGQVGGSSGQVDRTENVPQIRAATVYLKEAATEAGHDDPTTSRYEGTWYDLCPDGTVRTPYLDASGNLVLDASGQPQPCANPNPLYSAADSATYVGWSYKSSQNVWDVTSPLVPDAVYYVYEANAFIRGDIAVNTNLTVLADATGEITGQPDTGDGCTLNGAKNGNITFTGQGSGTYQPFLQDLLFLADRDLDGKGNTGSSGVDYDITLGGVLLAHEQFYFGGTTTFTGAVISEGACDSPNSPVSVGQNTVAGNFTLTHAGDLSVPLDSVTRITAWNEL